MISIIDFILLITPMLSGYLTNLLFPTKRDTGISVKGRPPPKVFGIVWFVLYLLIGFSWMKTYNSKSTNHSKFKTTVIYGSLVFILCLWLFIYNYLENKTWAVWIIVISLLFAMITAKYSEGYELLPLIVWILFATMLSFQELQQD